MIAKLSSPSFEKLLPLRPLNQNLLNQRGQSSPVSDSRILKGAF
jgi:hypothetical protein